jgi:hypothetical protein
MHARKMATKMDTIAMVFSVDQAGMTKDMETFDDGRYFEE